MKFLINEILDVQKLGVVVPLESQIEMTKQKWGHKRTFVVSTFPYVKGKTWKDIADTLIDGYNLQFASYILRAPRLRCISE